MIIKREKYTLRQLSINDADSITMHANNINIWNNVRDYFPHPYARQNAIDFITFVNQKENVEDFAIAIDGNVVGMAGIVPQTDVERVSAEIGYWLGEDYWNKGLMTNVVIDIVDYVFNNTPIIRLFAPVFEYNTASMRVLGKAGFKKIAILKNAAIKNNKVIDMHYHELVKNKI